MTFDTIAICCRIWGWEIKPEHYVGFKDYFYKMLERNRVMCIFGDGKLKAILTFFLTDSYDTLYKKSMWAVPDDEPDGHQIYIDKLVCSNFNKELRIAINRYVADMFPNVTEAYYHRAPKDRCVKLKLRREELCMT